MDAVKKIEEFNATIFITKCGSVSAAIRKLNEEGKTRGEISKMLSTPQRNIRYQWVRNVLITPVKKPKA